MKHQALLSLVVIAILASIGGRMPRAYAAQPEAGAAAQLASHAREATQDERVMRLQSYLSSRNSPMTEDAPHFVAEADRLGLDWKLVAAIAGAESAFGKHIPPRSYNGWGWGVYTGTNDGIHFKGWKDGITQVSEGLRYNYVDRGARTIEQIGRKYAASPRWPKNVRFFLGQIESYVAINPKFIEVNL